MWEHLYTTVETEKANLSLNAFELEGIAGFVVKKPADGPVILYRSYNPNNGIHLLSTEQEYNYVLNFLGFVAEGQVGFISPLPITGTKPFSRFRNPNGGDYLYTINDKEKADAVNIYHYIDEGVAGHVYDAPSAANVPLYRSYNPNNNDHFYTTSKEEYLRTINEFGFRDEDIACYLPITSHPTIIPLYRCHCKDPFDFFYSTSIVEITHAITNLNYTWEGIVGYVDTVPADNNIPFLRMVHSTRGDHFYVTDATDHANAIKSGYIDEGIACNIFSARVKGSIPLYRLLHVYDAVVHANLIAVGGDAWPAAQWNLFRSGFAGAAEILRQYGMRLNLLGEFFVPHAEADGYEDIDDDDEARDLTHDWSAPNFALDVFGVSTYKGDRAGFSAVDGSCDKSYACQMNGSVIEMLSVDLLRVTTAHEICHYLGLEHRDIGFNLMRKGVAANTTLLDEDQASDIKNHCFVRQLNYP